MPLWQRRVCLCLISLSASLPLIGVNANAQSAHVDTRNLPDWESHPPSSTSQDRLFLKAALEKNQAEIQLSQLALRTTANPEVIQIARVIIEDRTKMGNQGFTSPEGVSSKDQITIARLGRLSGEAFDRAYISQVIRDNKAALKDFKIEASAGSDYYVMTWADQATLVISHHLDMAKSIEESVVPAASNSKR